MQDLKGKVLKIHGMEVEEVGEGCWGRSRSWNWSFEWKMGKKSGSEQRVSEETGEAECTLLYSFLSSFFSFFLFFCLFIFLYWIFVFLKFLFFFYIKKNDLDDVC